MKELMNFLENELKINDYEVNPLLDENGKPIPSIGLGNTTYHGNDVYIIKNFENDNYILEFYGVDCNDRYAVIFKELKDILSSIVRVYLEETVLKRKLLMATKQR